MGPDQELDTIPRDHVPLFIPKATGTVTDWRLLSCFPIWPVLPEVFLLPVVYHRIPHLGEESGCWKEKAILSSPGLGSSHSVHFGRAIDILYKSLY